MQNSATIPLLCLSILREEPTAENLDGMIDVLSQPPKTIEIPVFHEERIWLSKLKVGEIVHRFIGGKPFMELKITRITPSLIRCSDWTFDRATGAEVDEDKDWGPHRSGSYIRPKGN